MTGLIASTVGCTVVSLGDSTSDRREDAGVSTAPIEAVDAGPGRDARTQVAYLKEVLFYGNRGTWGSLGLDDAGEMWPTPQAVAARFVSLCAKVRQQTQLSATQLRCWADLIAWTPNGFVPATPKVAELIAKADPTAAIGLDVRAPSSKNYEEILATVRDIFDGKTSLADIELLKRIPFRLTLDLESTVIAGKWGAAPAAMVNQICAAYTDRMVALGHTRDDLACAVYEMGLRPVLVDDPQNLAPSIFPIVMSIANSGNALSIKTTSINNIDAGYSQTSRTGCMFFTMPHLSGKQRDGFTFEQALPTMKNLCEVYAFQ